eukprot:CAMPEP_0181291106 /NCGR_PEP_ID=MMETSP1101-20121128/1784_1 /TAXON_ID=46948 /ORGANISM="Rhodomonas abbreviata, Strain Caron Lab Isolate" /LENGTH=322 /DNA_ID=CAMNT_0023395463 /DNA_START=35 /DNA_END=1003 /DNA_ORIENTATION=+
METMDRASSFQSTTLSRLSSEISIQSSVTNTAKDSFAADLNSVASLVHEPEEDDHLSEEELLLLDTICVPQHCDLQTALSAVQHSDRKIILVDGHEHYLLEVVEIRAQNLTIMSRYNEMDNMECLPLLKGKLIFCKGSSGMIEGLDLRDNDKHDGVIQMLGGEWCLKNCSFKCGTVLRTSKEAASLREGVYRELDVSVYCSGGDLSVVQCSLGGYDSQRRAYFAIYATKDAKITAEECSLSYCYGSAVEVRDKAQVRLCGCDVKRNECAFSAGFPNQARMELSRNRCYKNPTLWRKSPPSEIEDSSDNTDQAGYFISTFPDI